MTRPCAGPWRCDRPTVVTVDPGEAYCRRHAIWMADRLAREAVLRRDRGRCRACGVEGNGLDWAHIVTRASGVYIRWDTDAAVALCRKCHGRFTADPKAFDIWVGTEMGPGHFNALRRRENAAERRGGHVDLAAIIRRCREDEMAPGDRNRYAEGRW